MWEGYKAFKKNWPHTTQHQALIQHQLDNFCQNCCAIQEGQPQIWTSTAAMRRNEIWRLWCRKKNKGLISMKSVKNFTNRCCYFQISQIREKSCKNWSIYLGHPWKPCTLWYISPGFQTQKNNYCFCYYHYCCWDVHWSSIRRGKNVHVNRVNCDKWITSKHYFSICSRLCDRDNLRDLKHMLTLSKSC